MSVETPDETTSRALLSRRTLAKGVVWAAPALVVASAAPAVAASLRKDPGVNGWVLNSASRSRWGCDYTLTVDSTVRSPQTPDRAPYGLYLYDLDAEATVANVRFTYWIIGTQTGVRWSTRSGHSRCWAGPVRGAAQRKPDGLTYTPYTWTYTCRVDAAGQEVGADRVRRLWLGHFNVQGTFTQGSSCGDLTYWAERSVTVDRDGTGGRYEPEDLTFQRRNGALGPFSGAGTRARSGEQSAGREIAEGETVATPV